MLRNSYKYLSAIALMGVFTIAACGDDDDTGTGGSGGTSTTSSTSSGMGGSAEMTCTEACTVAYQCGAADMGALCPAFVPGGVDEMTFLNGANNDGCVATCEGNTLLKALINPDDCAATIGALKSASTAFADSCEGNAGAGGSGGGGTGGAGGAGGGT